MFGLSGKQWLGALLLVAAGLLLYVVFEDWKKGAALFAAGVLMDIGIDYIFTKVEKARGDID